MSENNNAPATTDTTPGSAPATTPAVTPETTPETTPATTPATTPEGETLLGGEQPPAVEEQAIEYTDFQLPEGFELDQNDAKLLSELGQQFKMPQEAVQKLVDLGVQMQQRQIAHQQQTIRSWVDAAKSDPEYGGEKLNSNLLTAQKAFTLPRGDKISKILFKSGLGNHPDVIGFMTEVGKLLEPDNTVHGRGSNTSNVTPASVWYDKS